MRRLEPLTSDPFHNNSLNVPLDNLSDIEVDIRPDSSLLVLRNACLDFAKRSSCGVYFFNWTNDHYDLVKFVHVEPKL
jgi:hypothetical protein